jgi:hypothetical protein
VHRRTTEVGASRATRRLFAWTVASLLVGWAGCGRMWCVPMCVLMWPGNPSYVLRRCYQVRASCLRAAGHERGEGGGKALRAKYVDARG